MSDHTYLIAIVVWCKGLIAFLFFIALFREN